MHATLRRNEPQSTHTLRRCTSPVEAHDGGLELSIRDDGRGGADPTRGSGLVGLTDRVDALGGTIEVASPIGQGTTLLITLPIKQD